MLFKSRIDWHGQMKNHIISGYGQHSYLLFNQTLRCTGLKMQTLLCLSFFCHLHVWSCVSLPTCHFAKRTAASAQYSSLLDAFLYLISTLPAAPPPGCVLPRRVSTVTSWIWSTVNIASHSSWIIKQHFFYCCSHVWSSKSSHEYSVGFEDWEAIVCTITISSGRMSERWLSKAERGRWFINV